MWNKDRFVLGKGLCRVMILAEAGLIDPDRIAAVLETLGMWAPLGAIALMILVSLIPVPAESVALFNGVVFGPILGPVLTWTGAFTAALLGYGLAGLLGRRAVEAHLGAARVARLRCVLAKDAPGALLLVRLVPVLPFSLINLSAGLVGVRWGTYVWTTALGLIPGSIAFTLIGGAVHGNPLLLVSVGAGLVLLLLAGARLARRYRVCGLNPD